MHTDVPSFYSGSSFISDMIYRYADITIEPADCIRLQDIRLSYDLNRNVLKKMPFRRASFYLYANNCGIIWRANKKGLDPDAYSFGSTPTPRTVSIGINVNF
ncbi:hypothetical protein D3C87_1629130 [compost metagenome]